MEISRSVFGVYSNRGGAEFAVSSFKDAGFSSSDISVLLPESTGKGPISESNTKAPEGAAVGVGSGAAIGGAVGWLLGAGALAIPGIGPVIVAGPILSTLAGIGVGCAFGGFAGSLVGVGISENEAQKYEGRLLDGGILIAVRCSTSEEVVRAKEILERTKAEDIGSSTEGIADGAVNIAA